VFRIREKVYFKLTVEDEQDIAGLADSLNIQFVVILFLLSHPLPTSILLQPSLVHGSICI
jgi:hypothetical protein